MPWGTRLETLKTIGMLFEPNLDSKVVLYGIGSIKGSIVRPKMAVIFGHTVAILAMRSTTDSFVSTGLCSQTSAHTPLFLKRKRFSNPFG